MFKSNIVKFLFLYKNSIYKKSRYFLDSVLGAKQIFNMPGKEFKVFYVRVVWKGLYAYIKNN